MKKRFFVLAVIFLVGIIFAYNNPNNKNNIRILTEEYKPLQYLNEDGELDGYAVSVVKDILKELNIPKEIELTDWDSAYDLALNEDSIALFSTAKNNERKDKFKWVGPIGTLKVNLYASIPNNIEIKSLDNAKNYKISAVKDYSYTQDLINLGFNNIIECSNEKEALNKLLEGEADLYLTSNVIMDELMEDRGLPLELIEKKFNISFNQFYIAFSKTYPDKLIEEWQKALEKVKQNSTLLFISD
ncbi:MAG TPA: transporter substrate-binding domain-containing protein [Candidatus Pacearchaeota archaeon]|nr:transporter substrate-binding domain-containing protein [Candidatus Pacearchaeota archaeon]